MAEVDTLQAFIASLQQQLKITEEAAAAAVTAPPASELRRRTRRYSDADSAAPSEAVTMVEEVQIHSDGVPLNVVVVIALVVFVTTYLFF
jgi:vesicle-associated membrane protein-associated protein A